MYFNTNVVGTLNGYRREPPEKGIFRELLALALRNGAEYVVGRRRLTPNALYSVACAIYLRANTSGVAQVSHAQLAADTFGSKRTVTAAIGVLEIIGIVESFRSRNRPREGGFVAIRVPGHNWNSIRRYLRRGPKPSRQLSLLDPSAESRADESSPPKATRTHERLEPTPAQIAYADDLNVPHEGLDLVDLGNAIEQARAAPRR